jgi:hypothetical protein
MTEWFRDKALSLRMTELGVEGEGRIPWAARAAGD